jgi:hypothetical protein
VTRNKVGSAKTLKIRGTVACRQATIENVLREIANARS